MNAPLFDARTNSNAPGARRVAFFHQNDVFGRQGGIERYLATLLTSSQGRAALVSSEITQPFEAHFCVEESGSPRLPQWMRYVAALFKNRRDIAAFLEDRRIAVLEFSRPEYLLAGWMFKGKRVVTIHGTGPDPGNRAHYVVHHLCCFLSPFLADRVQVVGRDPSGLPRIVQFLLGKRVAYIDAWYDDRFSPAPFPGLDNRPLKVFYAGRIAAQKNPELLYAIIREVSRTAPGLFEFYYFGSDYEEFSKAGLSELVTNKGFLGPAELAREIGDCHLGLLCSGYGEGSPFIVVESLACGRPFLLPPLRTLVEAYAGFAGIRIVQSYEVEEFVRALMRVREDILDLRIEPEKIAAQLSDRSQSRAARRLIDSLIGLAE